MTWTARYENEAGTQFMDISIADCEPSFDPKTGEKITEEDHVLALAERQNQKFAESYDREPYILISHKKLT